MDDHLAALVCDRAEASRPVCLYTYDLDTLAEHVSRVVSALPERCRMFYTMKANSAEPLLRAPAQMVAGFEIATSGELAKPGQRINASSKDVLARDVVVPRVVPGRAGFPPRRGVRVGDLPSRLPQPPPTRTVCS